MAEKKTTGIFNHKRNLAIIFASALIVWVVRILATYITLQQNAPIDDWRYVSQYSIYDLPLEAYIMLAGIAYIAFLAAVRTIISFFSPGGLKRLFVVGGMVAIAAILITISIPNFRKARMGMSVGGAKNSDAFRLNIERGYLPNRTSLTYEGLFYSYYFDTGIGIEKPEWLFTPSYATARTLHPLTGKEEHFLAVGLNSNLDAKKFERKKLNLVIVLDISGSMGGGFHSYYYNSRYAGQARDEDSGLDKMRIANKSLVQLLDHLNPEDRLGIVLFNQGARLAKPLRKVGLTKMKALKNHILAIRPDGGTNMEAGLTMGGQLFDDISDYDPSTHENRIIFLTDAMPNYGRIGKTPLVDISRKLAEKRIHTTFIGIGVDFNTNLVEALTKVRGANYYAVNSSWEFKKRMDKEFEYMVTPLVFDLTMRLKSDGYSIEKIMGSPEADESTNLLLKVRTLFPSSSKEGKIQGGIILLKLDKSGDEKNMTLEIEYEDRNGEKHRHEQQIVYDPGQPDFYENKGIRKAIVLSNYVRLLHNWIDTENPQQAVDDTHARYAWETPSVKLSVNKEYEEKFKLFKDYMEKEIEDIGDQTMKQELDVLENLF
ncbi:MAG: vWA domain-containing protein [Candidatus Rifleibacteriota bacterium]